ncbi:MAG: hypothetical protein WCY89_10565 [Flavobacteriaceae bacterium]
MATKKKITRVEGGENPASESKTFVPTPEAKGRATKLRTFAGLTWLLAIIAQVGAIWLVLNKPENFMTWTIVLIVVDLIFAIIGSGLWKKSNRLDPASRENKFMFFMQSQLGLVTAVVAFLPLIIVILTNKDLDAKQKGILGGIAGVALLVAGITGTDFNPPSVEEYTEQTARVEDLTGANHVYWTKSGSKYHIYDDCHSINRAATAEIFQGTVAQARELKNITELCKFCENTAEKAKGESLLENVEEVQEAVTE